MPTIFRALFFVVIAVSLNACSIARVSQPERVATEQLLFSRAMDRVSELLALEIREDTRVYVEEKYVEGTDTNIY